jgi:FkbH-like protein
MKYLEILKKNKELDSNFSGERYQVAVISNITISPIKEILELQLRENGLNAEITIANYDAIVQESHRFYNFKAVIVFWELFNLINDLQSKAYLMTSEELDRLTNKVVAEIEIVISNLKKVPLVIINRFSDSIIDSTPLIQGPLKKIGKILNQNLESKLTPSQILVDIDSVIISLGIKLSRDLRNFHSAKSIYTIEFYKKYCEDILPAFFAVNGKSKKVLVLDCDNTLWGGILGEDGEHGISMNNSTAKGKIFNEVQILLLGMQRQGVLLALCSKNNENDVNQILKYNSDMIINDDHIISKKINWNDKASNITQISTELNLGLDSFVFLDDSDFEVGLIKKELPMVSVYQVPSNLSEYPLLIKSLKNLFFYQSTTDEDLKKTTLYLQEKKRKEQFNVHDTIENYLESLGLKLNLLWNNSISVSRIAQMTQKTNQFNLTTKRYTETDIAQYIQNSNYEILSISVEDKFGDYGITGLCIINFINSVAVIDSFLMSCRIIGRNIEFAFFDQVVRFLITKKINVINTNYIRTLKNSQVEFFYESLGFDIVNIDHTNKEYSLDIKKYKMKNLKYIKIN